ncbi:MAG: DMT family transporter [bacterium]|nr:DMT family transporter [bacterium]
MKKTTEFKQAGSLWLLVAGAVCISFAPVFVKAIDTEVLGPTPIAFWRLLLGALILFGWGGLSGHSPKISSRIFGWALLAGSIFYVDLFVWHRSIYYAGAGMATILGNTQVFMTAILSYFVFKEVLTGRFFIAAISGILGVVLLVGVGSDVQASKEYLLGIAFGLATGVAYAHYIITVKHGGSKKDRPHLLVFMGWVSLTSAFVSGLSVLIEGEPFMPTESSAWLNLVGVALVAQAIGWWAISTGLLRIEASRSGLILLLQPILATVWGWLFFSEQLSTLQLLGAAITLTAVYYGSVYGTRRNKKGDVSNAAS